MSNPNVSRLRRLLLPLSVDAWNIDLARTMEKLETFSQ